MATAKQKKAVGSNQNLVIPYTKGAVLYGGDTLLFEKEAMLGKTLGISIPKGLVTLPAGLSNQKITDFYYFDPNNTVIEKKGVLSPFNSLPINDHFYNSSWKLKLTDMYHKEAFIEIGVFQFSNKFKEPYLIDVRDGLYKPTPTIVVPLTQPEANFPKTQNLHFSLDPNFSDSKIREIIIHKYQTYESSASNQMDPWEFLYFKVWILETL